MAIEVTTGPVARIQIVRPSRKNALDFAHLQELSAAVIALSLDRDVKVVVLSGSGEHFSAGADLNEVAALPDQVQAQRYFSEVAQVMAAIRRAPQPVVAVVRGWCLAGAVGLVGAADIAYAADSARFGLPEVSLGLFPMVISSVLIRQMTWRTLSEMALTGQPQSAAAMQEAGLLTAIYPEQELDRKVVEVAQTMAGHSAEALATGKAALWRMASRHWQEDVEKLTAEVSALAQGPEAKRRIAAFLSRSGVRREAH